MPQPVITNRREFLQSCALLTGATLLPRAIGAAPAGPRTVTFEKIVLTDEYYADGIAYGDINRDGHLDIVAGPFWYEGPDFKVRHRFYGAAALPQTAPASTSMFSFVYDFNGDGWPDILVLGRLLTTELFWYENPRGEDRPWKKHFVAHRLYGESKLFLDINGDGKPELIGHVDHRWGYLAPDWAHPELPWIFTPITETGKWPEYWHGTGAGDINGDGRMDLVLYDGWYEQPAEPGKLWKHHPMKFGPGRGGAQMMIYDVDGDGLLDVVSSIDAHRWGLSWFQQVRDAEGTISFKEHRIMGDRSEQEKFGAAFSQPHALCMADIDGDGLMDVIVSKRLWAHGQDGDVEPMAPPVVYWFQLTRDPVNGVKFIPHLVDYHSGGGVQIAAGDVTGGGLPDILTASKLGAFLFIPHLT